MSGEFPIRWHLVIAKNVDRLTDVWLKINRQQRFRSDVYTPKLYIPHVHRSTHVQRKLEE